ncbi:FACT complex subunit spt16 [Coemansia sp. RSA 1290]|nr:FACT complex component Spt16 [Coemansia mojavensis]KAJ1750812.1 FACT complex subunit spt16 [Coemansia sp. RSA 1821]KAJ1872771.1 FACT complex subunit spt16 [Coemansia sp. RSA 990]KAJ2632128.1 FACT complex subunit spt16 [Coemansia sp. RSA 1290]KAJ2648090.1 FACT complex subunit spt16 [Coemansia sp. RSA 1250]KAJ2669639.1 FACT complex subunit spt16 [Coemansia sp. RSA 1085]
MSDKKLDVEAFHRRVKRLLNAWKAEESSADSLLIIHGKTAPDIYTKTIAIHLWLFGYEFSDTVLLFTKDKLHITTYRKKAKILESLNSAKDGVELDITVVSKEPTPENKAAYEKIIGAMAGSGKRVGVIKGEKPSSNAVNEWNEVFAGSADKFDMQDVGPLVSDVLAVKEKAEIAQAKKAAMVGSVVMDEYFVDEMAGIFDEEKAVTNLQLAEKVEASLSAKAVAKQLNQKGADVDMVEWSSLPSVQSGGQFDVGLEAQSSRSRMFAGTVLCALNVRYLMYNASVARTFMIDPTPEQEKNYAFLLQLQRQIVGWLQPGTTMGAVYRKAAAYVQEHRPDLADHMVRDCGFVTGFEVHDGVNVLAADCSRVLAAGMVVVVRAGLQNLANAKASDARGQTYAYHIADTAVVTDAGAEVLTTCSCEPNDVSFFFNDDEPAAEAAPKREAGRAPATRTSAVLSSKFRSDEREEESNARQRREHQKELLERLQTEGMRRFAGSEGGDGSEAPTVRRFESYKRETALPSEARSGRIVVDERADTLVLPIYGMAVPFHIATVKSVSKSDEGEYVYLRLNLVSPGQGVGKKDALDDGAGSTFVRSLTFRSTDVARMAEIHHAITSLKRDQAKREAEKAQLADIVEQDRLVPVVGQRPQRLPDVFMRPLADGKRFPAALEIHSNGLRYMAAGRSGGTTVDILFNNVRHLFFQPCDRELLVLIHLHLKNPVMLGKKKTQDIQFYREASDAAFDETGNRRRRIRYGDEDEIEAEQDELRRRRQLNREFEAFAARIVEASNHQVELDKPFRNIAFTGVPARANVLLQPTVECLVHLSDTPFFVLTVADVELVHLERVQFGLKNFDMVFVFRDLKRTPVHVNTVPMKQLDDIKEWLDSVNLPFTEGPVNLNWTQIMKTVTRDPVGFYEDGGWSFLAHDSDAEDSGSEEEESEFSMSEDELVSSESDDDDGESDFAGESDDESEGDYDDDEESGEDWDELEAKAKAYDEKRSRPSPATSAPARKRVRR